MKRERWLVTSLQRIENGWLQRKRDVLNIQLAHYQRNEVQEKRKELILIKDCTGKYKKENIRWSKSQTDPNGETWKLSYIQSVDEVVFAGCSQEEQKWQDNGEEKPKSQDWRKGMTRLHGQSEVSVKWGFYNVFGISSCPHTRTKWHEGSQTEREGKHLHWSRKTIKRKAKNWRKGRPAGSVLKNSKLLITQEKSCKWIISGRGRWNAHHPGTKQHDLINQIKALRSSRV